MDNLDFDFENELNKVEAFRNTLNSLDFDKFYSEKSKAEVFDFAKKLYDDRYFGYSLKLFHKLEEGGYRLKEVYHYLSLNYKETYTMLHNTAIFVTSESHSIENQQKMLQLSAQYEKKYADFNGDSK